MEVILCGVHSSVRRDVDAKRVYYLSMEFLMGRSLLNALNNLGVVDQYTEALREMGYKLEDLIEKVIAQPHQISVSCGIVCLQGLIPCRSLCGREIEGCSQICASMSGQGVCICLLCSWSNT
jgi:hypothetical protein